MSIEENIHNSLSIEHNIEHSATPEMLEEEASDVKKDNERDLPEENNAIGITHDGSKLEEEHNTSENIDDVENSLTHQKLEGGVTDVKKDDKRDIPEENNAIGITHDGSKLEEEHNTSENIDDVENSLTHQKLEGGVTDVKKDDKRDIPEEINAIGITRNGSKLKEEHNTSENIVDEENSLTHQKLEGAATDAKKDDKRDIPEEINAIGITHDDSKLEEEHNTSEKIDDVENSPTHQKLEREATDVKKDDNRDILEDINAIGVTHDGFKLGEEHNASEKIDDVENFPSYEKLEGEATDVKKDDKRDLLEEINAIGITHNGSEIDEEHEKYNTSEKIDETSIIESKRQGGILGENINCDNLEKLDESGEMESKSKREDLNKEIQQANFDMMNEGRDLESIVEEEKGQTTEEKKDQKPIFGGMEDPVMEAKRKFSHSLDSDPVVDVPHWPERALGLRNFVKEKGLVAVTNVLRVLSGKKDDFGQVPVDENKEALDSAKDRETVEVSKISVERSAWNPLNYIRTSRDAEALNKVVHSAEVTEELLQPLMMKGQIILYTRLGCQDSKEVRLFLHKKQLRYVEINIDVYPSRRLELEKFTGSSAVPKVFFNEVVIGGLRELKDLDESGKLEEKIEYLVTEAPSFQAPLPPLSGEDDASSSGSIDELALIVRKMKEAIVVKDRFYKMRRFGNCFLGTEAVDFLSADQHLEREEAIEFGRKLARKLFFRQVLDENLFEDGNHLYRFLGDDPVSSQCHNIPRGIIEAKSKRITEISSRLRFLSYAIFEAYTSEDGKHVDYRSIHGSEEFARYLRIIQELQRAELYDISREERLAFFINLYNMMAIHAILVLGNPTGALERRKLFGEFMYVIGGCTYSLSTIQNGILRSNQRPPYAIMKPFSVKDKCLKVALPYPEPLIHFALVYGTRSGPALRCYSPANIDQELLEAARNFLRGGGLIVDVNAKVAHVSKILKWFSVDFGKSEVEVLKHASNYLEPTNSEALLDLLASAQLKVTFQPYDWGLNL